MRPIEWLMGNRTRVEESRVVREGRKDGEREGKMVMWNEIDTRPCTIIESGCGSAFILSSFPPLPLPSLSSSNPSTTSVISDLRLTFESSFLPLLPFPCPPLCSTSLFIQLPQPLPSVAIKSMLHPDFGTLDATATEGEACGLSFTDNPGFRLRET